ncbi:4449_t:CDS:1 [Dentiscutata erythropus]|uniref:4449_t:CDS:1 n=1 Tax=Dentiscutata erythropus TaxID=1348616 RepID=A0A9N9I0G8_9GLOM|nr:4449_t:CDS:1 [Dentiscutata erythropus]
MVNANEWLDKKIPADEREKATTLCIYHQNCSYRSSQDKRYYTYPTNEEQNNSQSAPHYSFYNVILEGKLDLNNFVNLNELRIEGDDQYKDKDRRQKLTSLKIDKCTKLAKITINYTTLGYLSLGSKPNLQSANFTSNKWLNFCDNLLKNQVGKLTSLILAKDDSDLKLEVKRVNKESLEYQLDVTKSNLDRSNQLWLESLVDSQKEILNNSSAYAHKQLERCKTILSEVLTAEEIQDLLRKIIEITELETRLNKASLKD